ncbi:S1C family serine protease [Streptomyces sp. TP-A0874]|uniref:S1C family serine protease n=1 Tax=Streptomyces sp. TP-A0874 TaxID=549819 RepID=UPI000852A908|nr:trypsin-like peptidase domain-containing protein [Streptomyces sp. TP-A0874]
MDEGKAVGPKPKWWSRPRRDSAAPAAPAAPAEPLDPRTGAGQPPVTDAPARSSADSDTPEAAGETLSADRRAAGAPETAAPSGTTAAPPEAATEPSAAQPLHAPDPYGTPPYGGPGPWAPAPPVQHPATPAHGIPLPPPPPAPVGGTVETPPPGPPTPAVQWGVYDPWAAPTPPTPPGDTGGPGGAPKRKRRRSGLLAGAVALALLSGMVGGVVGIYLERHAGVGGVRLSQAAPEPTDRDPESIAGIANAALPGVVTLHVNGGGKQGTGTGFVLDEKGHILTNNHVVEPAGSSGRVSVTFSGGETARAEVVGRDSGYDLAVVKVSGVSGLRPLVLGNSDSVQVGDSVVAIGAPFELEGTVTSGIISAKERPITAGGEEGDGSDISYVDALQTDAPINPGNSGGPLMDSKARVIGINSAIRAADGDSRFGGQSGSIGLGFAIPINQGRRVAEELINTGKASHPVIGVTLDMRYTGDGARVAEDDGDTPAVVRDGPADQAGVRSGDVITEVDGERVHSGEELIVKIRSHRPGDDLELTLRRSGKERTVGLTLGTAD